MAEHGEAFTKEVAVNENVAILTRLPIFTYWTTNYDTLIETGLRSANRNPDVKSESEQLPVILPDRDAIVYKMHGDVRNPAHAVLTKTDYELYEHRRPLFRTALKGDLISKVFLPQVPLQEAEAVKRYHCVADAQSRESQKEQIWKI